jgi:hypothetical protein
MKFCLLISSEQNCDILWQHSWTILGHKKRHQKIAQISEVISSYYIDEKPI